MGWLGLGKNQLTGEKGMAFPKIARDCKNKSQRRVVVGDENPGLQIQRVWTRPQSWHWKVTSISVSEAGLAGLPW